MLAIWCSQMLGYWYRLGNFEVSLDCSNLLLVIPTKQARNYPDACLIWIDAHADINTVESTDSGKSVNPLLEILSRDRIGNIHGMPVSFLLGIGSKVENFSWVQSILKPERLVYIGLRDVDPGEKKILREHNIKAFSMHDVDKYGIGKIVDMALDHVNPKRDRPIHLSFDVDALDPSVAPATGTPVSDIQILGIYFLFTFALPRFEEDLHSAKAITSVRQCAKLACWWALI